MADGTDVVVDDRPTRPALVRGWNRCCPQCGKGALFTGYLTVTAKCAACGESFTAQRADDGPAYLTILIVGHLMAPLFLWSYFKWEPAPVVMITVFTLGTVGLSLYLLPRLKGGLVALQWAKRMHGFGRESTPV